MGVPDVCHILSRLCIDETLMSGNFEACVCPWGALAEGGGGGMNRYATAAIVDKLNTRLRYRRVIGGECEMPVHTYASHPIADRLKVLLHPIRYDHV